MVERGDWLPREPQNWSPEPLFLANRYKARERWRDAAGGEFAPGVHYWVGGNTKALRRGVAAVACRRFRSRATRRRRLARLADRL